MNEKLNQFLEEIRPIIQEYYNDVYIKDFTIKYNSDHNLNLEFIFHPWPPALSRELPVENEPEVQLFDRKSSPF